MPYVKSKTFKANDIVFENGSPTTHLYVICRGLVIEQGTNAQDLNAEGLGKFNKISIVNYLNK